MGKTQDPNALPLALYEELTQAARRDGDARSSASPQTRPEPCLPAACCLLVLGKGHSVHLHLREAWRPQRSIAIFCLSTRRMSRGRGCVCAQTRVHDRRFERLGRAVGSASPVLPAETAVFSASGWPSSSSTSFRKKQQKTAGPWPRTSPELGWRLESDGGLESAGVQHLSYALPQSTRAISRPVAPWFRRQW